MKKTISLVLKILGLVLLGVLFVFVVGLSYDKFINKSENPEFLGISSAIVLSDSMEDKISAGDLIITFDKNNYKVDDIIMYRYDGETVTHRIVEIIDNGFITKGDANEFNDDYVVYKDDIIGKVNIIIPKYGYVVHWLKFKGGIFILLGCAALIFSIFMFVKYLTTKNNKNEEQI